MRIEEKERLRKKRHRRVRSKVTGTAERPRLNVSRSLQHIYAQLIDDTTGQTVAHASTADASLRESLKSGGNVEAAFLGGFENVVIAGPFDPDLGRHAVEAP